MVTTRSRAKKQATRKRAANINKDRNQKNKRQKTATTTTIKKEENVCYDIDHDIKPFVQNLNIDPEALSIVVKREKSINSRNLNEKNTAYLINKSNTKATKLQQDVEALLDECDALDQTISTRHMTKEQEQRFRDDILAISVVADRVAVNSNGARRASLRRTLINMVKDLNQKVISLDNENKNITVCPNATSSGYLARRTVLKYLVGFTFKYVCRSWLKAAWTPSDNISFSRFQQKIEGIVQPLRTLLYTKKGNLLGIKYGPHLLQAGHDVIGYIVYLSSAGRLRYGMEYNAEYESTSYRVTKVQTEWFGSMISSLPFSTVLSKSRITSGVMVAGISASVIHSIRRHGTSLEFFGRQALIHTAVEFGPMAIRVGAKLCLVYLSKLKDTVKRIRAQPECRTKKIKY